MSIFGSVFSLLKGLVKELGPLLPGLLALLKVKMNDGDVGGVHDVTTYIRIVADRLVRIADKAELAVSEISEGGTAVTGNEMVSLVAEIKEAIEDFSSINDKL